MFLSHSERATEQKYMYHHSLSTKLISIL
jgi:hypothetical protein